VVIACRSIEKAQRAAADMVGDVEVAQLDLANLTSVRAFAESVETVDVLANNHLGHFALTCLLGDKIKDRVISVASAMYHVARIHFDDLNWHTRRYSKTAAYSESKLANLLFVRELASPAQGARATLQALTTELRSGTYFAPRFNQWGKPRMTGLRKKARDPAAARRLWELSAELTGCDWR
jgi:NAD(P)-dependent dehydrogenase (short-subunit alcohol dehydrogenase family)